MATTYASPGVYVEELDLGAKPIEPLGASIAAFIGITAEASRKAINAETGERFAVESVLNKATLITNWTQFTDTFGGFVSGAYLPDAVYGYFANGGGPCYVTSLRATEEGKDTAIAASVSVPAAKGTSFKATAKVAGPSGNNLKVTVKAEQEKGKDTGNFTVSVGGETKSGLSMKKGDGAAFIGNVAFDSVEISDVGATTAVPAGGTYDLAGGGVNNSNIKGTIRNWRIKVGQVFIAHNPAGQLCK